MFTQGDKALLNTVFGQGHPDCAVQLQALHSRFTGLLW